MRNLFNETHNLSAQKTSTIAVIRNPSCKQSICPSHDTKTNLSIVPSHFSDLIHGEVVDIDDIIQKSDSTTNGFLKMVPIKNRLTRIRIDMIQEIDRTEIAYLIRKQRHLTTLTSQNPIEDTLVENGFIETVNRLNNLALTGVLDSGFLDVQILLYDYGTNGLIIGILHRNPIRLQLHTSFQILSLNASAIFQDKLVVQRTLHLADSLILVHNRNMDRFLVSTSDLRNH